jgi:hypothetical protein
MCIDFEAGHSLNMEVLKMMGCMLFVNSTGIQGVNMVFNRQNIKILAIK